MAIEYTSKPRKKHTFIKVAHTSQTGVLHSEHLNVLPSHAVSVPFQT